MAWEACEDPLRTCRECGEIYSEMEPDYQPDRDGCPSCYPDECERWGRVASGGCEDFHRCPDRSDEREEWCDYCKHAEATP
jgi:hypothetical protein